jgi:hypothetical protein
MADLEELAVRRDRGYLVRLIVTLALGGLASVFLWKGLTGQQTTGCVASMFLGSGEAPHTGAGAGAAAPEQPEPRK